MGVQDIALCPPKVVFPLHVLKIMVQVKVSGPPHPLEVWLGVSKNILPVKYSCFNKSSFLCQSNFM